MTVYKSLCVYGNACVGVCNIGICVRMYDYVSVL